MIEVTNKVISPGKVIAKIKSAGSGCVVTYIGLIRKSSHGKPVLSVEYRDSKRNAASLLQKIADEAKRRWPVENIAISHRIGRLSVGEINLVIAVASTHRREAFAACRFIINRFKQRLPTRKTEIYRDGS
jgi:molybdopterin synthase catalytic subunit